MQICVVEMLDANLLVNLGFERCAIDVEVELAGGAVEGEASASLATSLAPEFVAVGRWVREEGERVLGVKWVT